MAWGEMFLAEGNERHRTKSHEPLVKAPMMDQA